MCLSPVYHFYIHDKYEIAQNLPLIFRSRPRPQSGGRGARSGRRPERTGGTHGTHHTARPRGTARHRQRHVRGQTDRAHATPRHIKMSRRGLRHGVAVRFSIAFSHINSRVRSSRRSAPSIHLRHGPCDVSCLRSKDSNSSVARSSSGVPRPAPRASSAPRPVQCVEDAPAASARLLPCSHCGPPTGRRFDL